MADLIEQERRIWLLNSEINQRGIYVDSEAVEGALYIVDKFKADTERRFHEIVGYDPNDPLCDRPKSVKAHAKLKAWAAEQHGVVLSSIDKNAVADILEAGTAPQPVLDALECRKLLGASSVGKLDRFRDMRCADGRIRGCFVYHGTDTGRFTSEKLQLQNFPQGKLKLDDVETCLALIRDKNVEALEMLYGDVIGAIASCLRGMLCAAPGKQFVSADFSSIEFVVMAWLAGEEDLLEEFRAGADSYKLTYSKVFGVPIESVTEQQRKLGKVLALACQYQGFIGAMTTWCTAFRMQMSEEDKKKNALKWRDGRPKVVSVWKELTRGAIHAIETGKPTWVCQNKAGFQMREDVLYMRLPSGRRIAYYKPAVKTVEKYGKMVKEWGYWGVKQLKGTSKRIWCWIDMYGGKTSNNWVQGASRDILCNSMLNVNGEYPIVMDVHDEVISEVDEGYGSLEDYCAKLSVAPDWASDLPLKANGWVGKIFRKD